METERRLWSHLRAGRLGGWKFKRQEQIGDYIVDFVCFRARLIVEADGRRWHARREQALLDATRSLEAAAKGYETTRLLWEHLAHDPVTTAGLLREVHDLRLERFGSRSA